MAGKGEEFVRSLLLAAAAHRGLGAFATRHGKRLGAQRFVAGDTLAEAAEVIRRLNASGQRVTLDHLGEGVAEREAAREAAAEYLRMLDRIHEDRLDANVSLKLTQMGLDVDPALCEENVRAIVERAARYGNWVRIDMEQARYVDATLALYRRLRASSDAVGLVLQAYLRRSPDDLRALAPLTPRVRIVKGAYRETPEVAYQERAEIDRQYLRLVQQSLEQGCHTAIATHDEAMIGGARALITRLGVPLERVEFQMLYGIRSALAETLVREGLPVRIYVPYGVDWYPYFVRRLAERPANLRLVWRSLRGG